MDLFFIHGIVDELNKKLKNAFINKIYQLNNHDLLIKLRQPKKPLSLIISTNPSFYRLHLSEKKYLTPSFPPRFASFLRKYIESAKVENIYHLPNERVVFFNLSRAGFNLKLVVELMGRHSNVYLLNKDEMILEALHPIPQKVAVKKADSDGIRYHPPIQNRINIDTLSEKNFYDIISSGDPDLIVKNVKGISSLIAKEILFRKDYKWFKKLASTEILKEAKPCIIFLDEEKRILSPFPLKIYDSYKIEFFDEFNQAADQYYFEKTEIKSLKQKKESLISIIKKEEKKAKKLKEKLIFELNKAKKYLNFKEYGEIVKINLKKIKKGLNEIILADFTGKEVKIPLDPSLSPIENMNKFFKLYKKGKRGIEKVTERIEMVEADIAYLDSVKSFIEQARDLIELNEVEDELIQNQIIKKKEEKTKKARPKTPSLPIRRWKIKDDIEIICGKNNLGNELIYRKLSSPDDIWMHVRSMPGAHVLIKPLNKQSKINDETLLIGAAIAVYFSSARDSGKADVDYTKMKYVKKIKGAKPGLVTYREGKTIIGEPKKFIKIIEKEMT